MSSPAPGWYPDAQGTTRWWDGYRWTAAVQPVPPPPPPRVPDGTPTGTVWIWLIVILPLFSEIPVVGFLTDMRTRMVAMFPQLTQDPSQPGFEQHVLREELTLIWTPWYAAVLITGVLIYALTVLFAYLDWRQLRGRGFDRPFHWAWGFLVPPWVYVIGRSVVVRRQSGRGLAPLWVLIAVEVVVLIGLSIWMGYFFTQMMQDLMTSVSSLSS